VLAIAKTLVNAQGTFDDGRSEKVLNRIGHVR
jgi:hypothetical protein